MTFKNLATKIQNTFSSPLLLLLFTDEKIRLRRCFAFPIGPIVCMIVVSLDKKLYSTLCVLCLDPVYTVNEYLQ